MVNLPTAVQQRKKFIKSSINVTTNDYMYLKPVYSRELMANQSTDINMSVFSRLYPMQNPAYARCKFVNRAFFVPYRTVFPSFDRFLSQEKNRSGALVSRVHSISMRNIFYLFVNDSQDTVVPGSQFFGRKFFAERIDWTYPDTPERTEYDLMYYNDAEMSDPSEAIFMKFTKRGKVVYDTLINLGYNIPQEYSITPDMDDENQWNVQFSALPLLSMAKIWFDWYRNNKYEPLVGTQYIESFFNLDQANSFTPENVCALLLFISQISYPVDSLTCASVNPVTPNIAEPVQEIKDVTLPNVSDGSKTQAQFSTTSEKTPILRNSTNGTLFNVTQYILNALNRMTDYLQRDGLVGGKTLDRLLAHYGVRMPEPALRRSVYIGKYEQPLTIMDVTQTAPQTSDGDAKTSVLGYQAGRGMTTDRVNGHFQYETKEFGQIIIISQLVPEVSYYQGVKREMLHLNRFDFFTSEYDALGPQAISVAEVWNGVMEFDTNRDNYLLWNNHWYDQFGFHPSRYFEYKHSCNQDVLSGDFRVPRAGQFSLASYHQFRQIRDRNFDDHKIRTCLKFDSIMADIAQYDRIFNSQDSLLDHFISFYDFQVTDYMPCREAFEGYDFGDDEEHRLRQTVAKNGTMF